jgi:hypothetical protein
VFLYSRTFLKKDPLKRNLSKQKIYSQKTHHEFPHSIIKSNKLSTSYYSIPNAPHSNSKLPSISSKLNPNPYPKTHGNHQISNESNYPKHHSHNLSIIKILNFLLHLLTNSFSILLKINLLPPYPNLPLITIINSHPIPQPNYLLGWWSWGLRRGLARNIGCRKRR